MALEWSRRGDLHIDGGETTVGEGAADSAGEGEAGVELEAAQLGRGSGLGLLLDSVKLDAAGGRSHCDARNGGQKDAMEWRWGSGLGREGIGIGTCRRFFRDRSKLSVAPSFPGKA